MGTIFVTLASSRHSPNCAAIWCDSADERIKLDSRDRGYDNEHEFHTSSLPVTYIRVMSGRRILDVVIHVPPDLRSLAVAAASAKRPHDGLMRIAH